MRKTLCSAVIATLVLATTGTSSAAAAGPLRGYPSPKTKVASGTWDGHHWTLLASESRTATWFSHCLKLVLEPASSNHGGLSCAGGGLPTPGELLPTSAPAPGVSYGIAPSGYGTCPTFVVLAGLVVTAARTVVVTLAPGKTVTTETIPSPPGFAQSLRFWATHIPCGARVSALVARDAHGRIVAREDPRLLPHFR